MDPADEYHAAAERYRERFGEDLPTAMLPGSPAAAALLRECIKAGSTDPIEAAFPPGTYT